MCSEAAVVWGVIGLVFGPPAAVWPYTVARWGEVVDAIGRRPSGRVEPAGWYVALTRAVGVVLCVVGLAFVVFCVVV